MPVVRGRSERSITILITEDGQLKCYPLSAPFALYFGAAVFHTEVHPLQRVDLETTR